MFGNFDITWILTAVSLAGSYLNAKKKIACFYLWGIGEIFWFILDIYNGVYGRSTLDFVSLCMAVYGAIEWNRDKRTEG